MKKNIKLSPFIIPICIIIGAICAYLAGAWMFFSSLIAAFGILSLVVIELGFNDLALSKRVVKIYHKNGPDELKIILRPKLIFIIVCNFICLTLSFYPFAFMSRSFSRLFHMWEPYEGGILVFLISLFNIVISSLLLWSSIHNIISIDKIVVKIKENLDKQETEQRKKKDAKLKKKKLIESIAPTDNVITIGETLFAVSSVNNKVIIGEIVYNLSDIITFSISDNSTQIFSPVTSTTKTNTGSMVGRAVVGGVLSGGMGAIIGSATAKKETITEGGSSIISHDYTLHISMDNLTSPLISIHIGDNTNVMEQAKALLNVIVKRNNSL